MTLYINAGLLSRSRFEKKKIRGLFMLAALGSARLWFSAWVRGASNLLYAHVPSTTGKCTNAECLRVCRVPDHGHSAKTIFAECQT